MVNLVGEGYESAIRILFFESEKVFDLKHKTVFSRIFARSRRSRVQNRRFWGESKIRLRAPLAPRASEGENFGGGCATSF